MAAWYDEQLEAQARAYDRSQARLFLLRFALAFRVGGGFLDVGTGRARWRRGCGGGSRSRFRGP